VRKFGLVIMQAGQRRTIFEYGPFTLTGECDVDRPHALVVAATKQEHSAIAGPFGSRADWSSSQPTQIAGAGSETEPSAFGTTTFSALAPDGSRFSAIVQVGRHVAGHPDECVFAGFAFVG
jgi:hypothetical protein